MALKKQLNKSTDTVNYAINAWRLTSKAFNIIITSATFSFITFGMATSFIRMCIFHEIECFKTWNSLGKWLIVIRFQFKSLVSIDKSDLTKPWDLHTFYCIWLTNLVCLLYMSNAFNHNSTTINHVVVGVYMR